MNKLTLKFPNVLKVASGGLFVLTLSTAVSSADAQVFFLQGEQGVQGVKGDKGDRGLQGVKGDTGEKGDGLDCDGTNCTVPANQGLIVNGQAIVDTLTVNVSYWLPEPDCPTGYTRDYTLTDRILCIKGADEMVKVGNFWIDWYEASIWSNADCTGQQYGSASDCLVGNGKARSTLHRIGK